MKRKTIREHKELFKKHKITSWNKWKEVVKSGKLPKGYYTNPPLTFKLPLGDFTNTGRVANQNKKYRAQ